MFHLPLAGPDGQASYHTAQATLLELKKLNKTMVLVHGSQTEIIKLLQQGSASTSSGILGKANIVLLLYPMSHQLYRTKVYSTAYDVVEVLCR